MKKMKLKLILSGALLLSTLGIGSIVSEARNIGELSRFEVTKSGHSTSRLKKLNNSQTVINLGETNTGKLVRVESYVYGVYKGGTTVNTGYRKAFSDSTVAGQNVNLVLSKGNSSNSNFYVYGSWSPDSY